MYLADTFCSSRQFKAIHTYNAFGSSLVELCCTFDIHIMNGKLFIDTEKKTLHAFLIMVHRL